MYSKSVFRRTPNCTE